MNKYYIDVSTKICFTTITKKFILILSAHVYESESFCFLFLVLSQIFLQAWRLILLKKNAMYIKYNFDLLSLGKDNLEEIISILKINGIASEGWMEIFDDASTRVLESEMERLSR